MMELDDFKNTWKEAKSPVQNSSNVNPETLKKMNSKYRSKIKKITIPEIVGSLVCLAAAAFIAFSFDKLDTFFLQGAGVLSILLLLALPIISLQSIWRLSKAGDLHKTYAETLKEFAVEKIRFIRLQKLNVTLSYLLLVTIIVLLYKFFGGRDISNNKYYWIFSFSFGYIFLMFYSKWVMSHYRKALQQSEELLRELTA
jgi:hypothetical protein